MTTKFMKKMTFYRQWIYIDFYMHTMYLLIIKLAPIVTDMVNLIFFLFKNLNPNFYFLISNINR